MKWMSSDFAKLTFFFFVSISIQTKSYSLLIIKKLSCTMILQQTSAYTGTLVKYNDHMY